VFGDFGHAVVEEGACRAFLVGRDATEHLDAIALRLGHRRIDPAVPQHLREHTIWRQAAVFRNEVTGFIGGPAKPGEQFLVPGHFKAI
jgi:hypothetical protein